MKLNVLRPSVFANGPMGKKVNIGKIYNNTNNDKQPKKKNNKIKNGTIFLIKIRVRDLIYILALGSFLNLRKQIVHSLKV